ncbi:MAG: PAS domain S-box protein [Kofleriaceae bacterium]
MAELDPATVLATIAACLDHEVFWAGQLGPGLLYASPSFERFFGVTECEVRADPARLLERIHPDDRPLMSAVMNRESDWELEYRILRGSQTTWLAARTKLVLDRTDGAKVMVGTARDITADKLRSDQGQRTETFLHAVLESSVDAIFTIDEVGTIELCNSAVEGMFGYPVQELTGRNITALISNPTTSSRQTDLMSSGEVVCVNREIKARRRDGQSFSAELTVSELQLQNQRRYLGVIRDITDRKKAELSMAESQRRLRVEVAYDLHDTVGQLLAGGRILAQNLLSDVPASLSSRMTRVVGLLTEALHRVRSASQSLAGADVDEALFGDALRGFAATASALYGIQCVVNVDASVTIEPSTEDKRQVLMIAREAVVNACRHSGCRTVEVLYSLEPEWFRLRVRDDGSGITDPPPKNGLGLASMDHRARLIGGSLSIGPGPRTGTQVELRWPRQPSSA